MRSVANTALVVVILVCLGWGIARADPITVTADTLQAALTSSAGPVPAVIQAGDTLTVQLEILAAGPAFNAFDAYIRYDPAVLSFLPPASQQDQVGPLMSDACYQSFHLFSQAPDSMTLEINFSLLCQGVSVTGPGVAYRVNFLCRDVDVYTHLVLLTEPGRITRFYDNGYYVQPQVLTPLFVQIGEGASPVPRPGVGGIVLHAAPNPLNPRTTFSFVMPHGGLATLAIYDVAGRLMRHLQGGMLGAGAQRVVWDGLDDMGFPVESGAYFGLIRSTGESGSVKVTVIR